MHYLQGKRHLQLKNNNLWEYILVQERIKLNTCIEIGNVKRISKNPTDIVFQKLVPKFHRASPFFCEFFIHISLS